MNILQKAGVEYLVCGAFALEHYTAIHRKIHDFDLAIRPHDVPAHCKLSRKLVIESSSPFRIGLGRFFADTSTSILSLVPATG